MPMGGPLMPEGVMPAAMLAGFMLPPMEAGPRGPGWFMNWLLYAWVGPIWKEEHTFNGRRRKKKNKMPHALKVQGRKVRGLRGEEHFPTGLQLGTRRVSKDPVLQGPLLPSADLVRKCSWRVWVGWGAVTPRHRQHSQGGRQGTGKWAGMGGVQGGHRKRRWMRMEAEALS